MNAGNTPFQDLAEKKPTDVLQKFVGLFMSKGWLNQTLRIKHRDRRYRISCCEKKFFAYRINDSCGVSPGYPGWPVCIITHDQIIDDTKMSAFASTEPSPHDWLRCLHDGDFELL
jgi:hypothetical protein